MERHDLGFTAAFKGGGSIFRASFQPGTDVMIFKIFSPKNLAKILAFLTKNKASFCKKCDHNIGF
jgi:hypothetical protein